MPAPTDHPPDPELTAEQHHLARAREELARMREHTASLDTRAAADWVNQQFLDSLFALRMEQLADDPTVPLFFGRIDYHHDAPDVGGERFHLGRRHVSDASGDPLVVDWRAPVSVPFYRASASEPMGLARRRRFGFRAGVLTAYEDDLHRGGAEAHSALLEAEIERPRTGPMRDIVATIQPEQDVLVRADLSSSLCIQGAPGTGKTAVGLHRAAYLLFTHRDRLVRSGVLVVGPNASFLRYIRDVLPALGEADAGQSTIEELVHAALPGGRRPDRVWGTDAADVAVLKGDARMAEVLRRAVWSHVRAPTEPLVVPRGSRRWRVPPHEVAEVVQGLRDRGVRYEAARAMLPQALAHRVLVRMELAGESPDDRVQSAVARSTPVRRYAAALWPPVVAATLLHRLLGDPEALAAAAEGLLDDDEQASLRWDSPPRSAGRVRWSVADAVLLDELADLLERTGSLGLVIADEAQDLSPMMLRAIGRRCSTGSLTVLGDLAQATTPWASRSWDEALEHLGRPGTPVSQLTRGFRVPASVLSYAARLLPTIAPGLEPPSSVRRSPGDLSTEPGGAREAAADVRRLLSEREGSVGLVLPDARIGELRTALTAGGVPHSVLGEPPPGVDAVPTSPTAGTGTEFDTRVDLVPASLAKGLEFDHVVLLDPSGIVAAEPDRVTGLRRLYVCLTRAVSSLVVRHGDLPAELR